jgi:hypothetical protein
MSVANSPRNSSKPAGRQSPRRLSGYRCRCGRHAPCPPAHPRVRQGRAATLTPRGRRSAVLPARRTPRSSRHDGAEAVPRTGVVLCSAAPSRLPHSRFRRSGLDTSASQQDLGSAGHPPIVSGARRAHHWRVGGGTWSPGSTPTVANERRIGVAIRSAEPQQGPTRRPSSRPRACDRGRWPQPAQGLSRRLDDARISRARPLCRRR